MATASNASRPAETGGTPTPNARPAIDLTAVTARDDFLLELGDCLGGKAAVHPVESMTAALEHIAVAKRGQVLVIDSRDIADVRAEVTRARAQAPHAVVLVFTPPETEAQITAAVKDSKVFGVLPLPVDKSRTNETFERALAEALAHNPTRTAAERGPAEQSTPISVESFHTGSSTPPRLPKPAVLAGAVAAALAVAVGAYLVFGPSSRAPTPPSATKAVVPSAARADEAPVADDAVLVPQPTVERVINGKVDDLLERARLAMRERRYSEPSGDNALLYYRSAAAADATNGEAVDGLQRVAAVLAARFEESMSANRLEEAALTLANFRQSAPTDSRIGAFDLRLSTAQISKALADGNIDRAAALVRVAQQSPAIAPEQIAKWKNDITRRQDDARVQHLAGIITDRIRDGRLIEPAEESAKAYLQQLREASPAGATTQRLTRDLNAAYLRKAREATVANRAQEADHWLAEAKAGGVTANDLQSVQHDAATARQKAVSAESDRMAQAARERMRDGRLTDPAQDSAAYFVNQIQANDAANAVIAPLSHELAASLLERARGEAQAGKPAQVDADLTQARRFGADPKDILAVQQVPAGGKATNANAVRSTGAAPGSLAANLKRTRYAAPEYPSKALTMHIAGAVTIEYTVNTKGDTQDAHVLESNPPGIFDRAALAAVKRWRYDVVLVDGAPVEVPVRTSIRFELPN